MKFTSKLVHVEGNHFGFKFEEVDINSMTHLRRFLEFNYGEPEKIKQELFFLIKRKIDYLVKFMIRY